MEQNYWAHLTVPTEHVERIEATWKHAIMRATIPLRKPRKQQNEPHCCQKGRSALVRALLRVSNVIDAIVNQIGKLSGLLVTAMILLGVYNVIARYVGRFIGRSLASNSYIESQWYMFSIVFFLGFSYILRRNENVRVDFLYANWTPKRKALVNLIGNLLFLIPFCILGIMTTYQSVMFSWQIRELSSDPGGLPRYPIKTMILIAFALLIIQGISEIIKHVAVLTDSIDPVAEQAIEAYHPEPVE